MTETRAAYHKEVKTASFQGKSITVENLTPVLSPRRGTSVSGKSRAVFMRYSSSTRRAGRRCTNAGHPCDTGLPEV